MSQEPTQTTANLRPSAREARLLSLLSRRLRSARGTAYLEFAVLVPFFLFAFLFAADFTRVLYAEQQVEIATRALCDIESHLVPGARDRNGVVGSGCPGWQGKGIVRQYVAEALAKEGIDDQFWDPKSSVYCKGSFSAQEGFSHTVVNKLLDILKGQTGAGTFIDIMAKILGGVVDVLTLRTFRYLSEVFPTDRVVKTAVSVYIRPFSPHAAYTLFGRHGRDGVMLIPAAAPRQAPGYYDRALLADQRVRYYCHMPSMDTAARANIRRLGVTVVALAATVGAVGLMRVAARALAGGFSAEATRRADAVQPSRLPAPKTYDLVALVPEDLRLNLGGMVAQSTKTTMPMPLDQAVQTSANEARAQGWKALDLPLAYELATLRDFGGLYLTPDRRIVRRAHTPLAGGGTQREDFSLPAGARLSLDRPMTFEEAVGLADEQMLARFPDVLRAVQVAQPVYTQVNAHDTGAAFLVVGLSSWEEADVRKQLAATYARAGWTRRADLPGAWVKANLSATWDVAPRAAGVGSVVTVRYADDEILVNRKENEDDE